MPDLALGLMIGEGDADSHIPPIGVDGALQAESGPYLNTEEPNLSLIHISEPTRPY